MDNDYLHVGFTDREMETLKIFLLLLSVCASLAASPWAHPFTPVREFTIGPSQVSNAIATALPGDEYWLTDGDYGGVTFTNAGTFSNPVVWRAQNRATFDSIFVTGPNNWFWGLELTGSSGIEARSAGTHVINCVIHDVANCGIGGWDAGVNHVYYGNVVSGVSYCYPIYTQNRFATAGWKYIVQNYFLDALTNGGSANYNLHAYAEQGFLSGFHMEKNVSSNGRWLLGGYNEPVNTCVIRSNYFYKSSPQLGYQRAAQVEFSGNYLGLSGLSDQWLWTVDSASPQYLKPLPNKFLGNTIYTGGLVPFVDMISAAYTPFQNRAVPPLDPSDSFNFNVYLGSGTWNLWARGKNVTASNLSAWRRNTSKAGASFDTGSQSLPAPTGVKAFVDANEYEVGRGNIVVYNWPRASQVAVDVSAVGLGSTFTVRNPKDFFGLPVASGTYTGAPIQIPIAGNAEFAVFVITQ